MKVIRILMVGAYFSASFMLPSFVVKDAGLSAEPAIRGHVIYRHESGIMRGEGINHLDIRTTNGLFCYDGSIRSTIKTTRYFINLDDLTLNEALVSPPSIKLNISKLSGSKKALVRWNID